MARLGKECVDANGTPLRLRPGFAEEESPRFFPADGSAEELPDLSEHKNLVAEVLTQIPDLYTRLKVRQTTLGTRVDRCIKAGIDTAICKEIEGDVSLFAGDAECYDTFSELFDVIVARLHGMLGPGQVALSMKPARREDLRTVSGKGPSSKRLDPSGKIVQSVKVRAVRNIKGFRFIPAMSRQERSEVESLMAKAMRGLAPAVKGVYLPLKFSRSYAHRAGGMDDFEQRRLKQHGLLFGAPLSDSVPASGSCRGWPNGRGIFMESERSLAVWVNQQEHVTMVTIQPGDDLQKAYRDIQRSLDGLAEVLRRSKPGNDLQAFAYSERLGFLTSSPTNLGTGLRASVVLKVPNLTKLEVSDSRAVHWRAWTERQMVQVEPAKDTEGNILPESFELSNMETFNVSDVDIIDRLLEVAAVLVQAELQLQSGASADELFQEQGTGRSSQNSCRSVTSFPVESVGDDIAQDLISGLITTNVEGERDNDLNELRDRLKNVLCSKLDDGSLDRAVEEAARDEAALGAARFIDVPPPPPGGMPEAAGEAEELDFMPSPRAPPTTPMTPAIGKVHEMPHKKKSLEAMAPDRHSLKHMGSVNQMMLPSSDNNESLSMNISSPVSISLPDSNSLVSTSNKEQETLESMRLKAASILTQALDDGNLEKVLAEVQMERTQDICSRTANLLIRAADDGSLDKALAEVKMERKQGRTIPDDLRSRAANLLVQAADDGNLERALAELKTTTKQDGGALEDMRLRAQKLLSEAAGDGSLERVLEDVKMKEKQHRGSMEEIRSRAADILTQAADDGLLEKVLAEVKTKRKQDRGALEYLRSRAAAILSQAADDGHLEKVLAEVKRGINQDQSSLENIRSRAASLLMRAADDGNLERILAEVKTAAKGDGGGLEGIRSRAAILLTQAADDGSLEKALAEVKDERKHGESSLESIRSRTAILLTQATKDGSLEKALAEVKMETERENGRLKTIRSRAANVLMQAADDGSLEKVLAEVKTDTKQAHRDACSLDLRQRAAVLLAKACDDGRLEEALREMKGEQVPGQADLYEEVVKFLLEAALDGELEHVLSEIKKECMQESGDLDTIRARAANLLIQAADNGNLQKVLSEATQDINKDMNNSEHLALDSIRQRAANLLLQADKDGTLERVLKEAKSASVQEQGSGISVDNSSPSEDMRARAANFLIQAAENGNLEKVLAEVKMGTKRDRSSLEGLRSRAANVLIQAVDNGNLEEVLAEVKAEKGPDLGALDNIRSKAIDALMLAASDEKEGFDRARYNAASLLIQAAENGNLEKVLAEVKQETKKDSIDSIRAKATNLLIEASDNGDLAKALAAVKSDLSMNQLRVRTTELMLKAAENGDLENALAATSRKVSLEYMRAEVLVFLKNLVVMGGLDDLVGEVKRQHAEILHRRRGESIRQKASASLLKASETGALKSALSSVKGEDDLDAVRQRAAALLIRAGETGELEKALRGVTVQKVQGPGQMEEAERDAKEVRQVEQRLDGIRLKAANLLVQAADSGELGKALQQVQLEKKQEVQLEKQREPPALDSIRAKAGNLLLQAADDGNLEKVLKEVLKEAKQDKRADLKALRSRTGHLLLQAANNGDLEKVLQEVKAEAKQDKNSLDGIRSKAANLLAQAADDGSLDRVLKEVKAAKTPGIAEVRDRARDQLRSILVSASDDGSSENTIGTVFSKPGPEATRIASRLLQAETSGELDKAMARLGHSQTQRSSAEDGSLDRAPKEVKTGRTQGIAEVRDKAASLLSQAAESGALEQIVRDVKSQGMSSIAQGAACARDQLRSILVSASDDGSSENTIGTVFSKPGPEATRIASRLLQAETSGELDKAMAWIQRSSAGEAAEGLVPRPPPSSPTTRGPKRRSGSETTARAEAAKALAEANAWSPGATREMMSMEAFSAQMFVQAFSEKGKRLEQLQKLVEDAEQQIKLRDAQCRQLQSEVSRNRLEIVHMELDIDWHKNALENADARRQELQNGQRQLLGKLHGQMYSLSDVTGPVPPRSPRQLSAISAPTSLAGTMIGAPMPVTPKLSMASTFGAFGGGALTFGSSDGFGSTGGSAHSIAQGGVHTPRRLQPIDG
eukprot:TRINITY_DN3170_c0_g1_i2.p1 TRINITY_DN3170_c0_g1~~TRINITY_DN3170_c0_g1_i2.p1  ORF type:complete len:2091 (-),score=594.53 TRINITY_DN3170_c0_g1_i2:131-6403(-)